VISWVLEVEDAEDVASTVDDMEVKGDGVREGWKEDSGTKLMGGGRLYSHSTWEGHEASPIYGIICSRLYQPKCPDLIPYSTSRGSWTTCSTTVGVVNSYTLTVNRSTTPAPSLPCPQSRHSQMSRAAPHTAVSEFY
jgi:hypothetical protein